MSTEDAQHFRRSCKESMDFLRNFENQAVGRQRLWPWPMLRRTPAVSAKLPQGVMGGARSAKEFAR